MRGVIKRYLTDRQYFESDTEGWRWRRQKRDDRFLYTGGPDSLEIMREDGQYIRLDYAEGVCNWTLTNIDLEGLFNPNNAQYFCRLKTIPTFENVPYSGFALVETDDESMVLYSIDHQTKTISKVEVFTIAIDIARSFLMAFPDRLVDGLLLRQELREAMKIDPEDFRVVTIDQGGADDTLFILRSTHHASFPSALFKKNSIPYELTNQFEDVLNNYADEMDSKRIFFSMDSKTRLKRFWEVLVTSRQSKFTYLEDKYVELMRKCQISHPEVHKQMNVLLEAHNQIQRAIVMGEKFAPPYYIDGQLPLSDSRKNLMKLRHEYTHARGDYTDFVKTSSEGLGHRETEEPEVFEIKTYDSLFRLIDFGDDLQLEFTLQGLSVKRWDKILMIIRTHDWENMDCGMRAVRSRPGGVRLPCIESFTLKVLQCKTSEQYESMRKFMAKLIFIPELMCTPEVKSKMDEIKEYLRLVATEKAAEEPPSLKPSAKLQS